MESLLTKLFLAGNFIYGLGFAAFYWSEGVTSSSLYRSLDGLSSWLPQIWGIVLMLAVVTAVVPSSKLLYFGTFLGTLCWVFASLVYLLTGYTLVFFTVGLLYLGFWVALYLVHQLDGITLGKITD